MEDSWGGRGVKAPIEYADGGTGRMALWNWHTICHGMGQNKVLTEDLNCVRGMKDSKVQREICSVVGVCAWSCAFVVMCISASILPSHMVPFIPSFFK